MTSVLPAADIVVVEMLRSNLHALVEEMLHLLVRSAYSTLMRESRDCSFLVLDPQGRVVTTTPGSFSHAFAYRRITRAILDKFGPHGLRPDDVIISNHPYQAGVPHSPDLSVTVPVFVGDRLVGFSCSIAHKPDMGGAVAGSASSKSTELYQEGFLLPLTKLYDAGAYREDIENILVANVRDPDLVLGDTRAQVGTTRVGAQRVAALVRRYGIDQTFAAYDQMVRQSATRMRAALRAWPDGTHEAEGFLDHDGVRLDLPIRFHVRATKHGDALHLDFSDSDDQALGPVNVRPPWGERSIFYALLSMADPDLPFSDGLREVVSLTFREGSVLNPRFPAPVGAATVCSHRLTDVVLEVLGHFQPGRVTGGSGGSGGAMAIHWHDTSAAGRKLLQYELFGSALGGRAGKDGLNGVSVHGSNHVITPIEILETQYPLRVKRYELIADSAGPGTYRGGASYRRDYELLVPATINRRADRDRFPGNGVLGGRPGRLGAMYLNPDTAEARKVPGAGQYEVPAGTVLRVEGAGAGGLGDPFARDPARVLADVRMGYVSLAAARDAYGVAIDRETLAIDESQTLALRSARRDAGFGDAGPTGTP